MIRYGINLIRNIHYDLYQGSATSDVGIEPNRIVLETSSEIDVPYLLIRRGDDVPAPYNPLVPIAYFFNLEYVISEEGVEEDDYQADQVGTIRTLDELFMKRLRESPLLRSTSDVQEGLSEDRLAYLLSRRIELAADIRVELDPDLELDPEVA